MTDGRFAFLTGALAGRCLPPSAQRTFAPFGLIRRGQAANSPETLEI